MKVEEVKKSDQIDKLRRRLLKLGAYIAPTVTIISLSYSRAQAQACTPFCNPNEPCPPDLAPPIFRKKRFNKQRRKRARLNPLSQNPLNRKSPWDLKNPLKDPLKDPFRKGPFNPGLAPEKEEK